MEFPDYVLVTLAKGAEVKVAPLRLDSAENLKFITEVGEAIDSGAGASAILLKNARPAVDALRRSLAENHSEDEIKDAIGQLRISQSLDSPYCQCIFAMLGRVTDDKRDDE